MAELFVKIFNIGIATSWLVLAIIVMRFLFKKAPKWLNPVLWGLVRPRIYLPFNISDKYAGHVIAHEQTHIIRHDHWFKSIGFLLLAVYWFNPFLWIAYILLCRDIELACDERVIKDLKAEERADYSQALLSCSISHRMITACPLAFGEIGVKARVKNVLSYKKPAFWIVVTAVIFSIGLAVGFLTNPINKPNYKAPFECVYEAKEILYDQTIYSFTYIPNDWLVMFYATEDTLYVKNDVMAQRENDTWAALAGFAEIELTKENFDNYFRREGDTVAGWHDDGNSASKVRKNNFKAWRVIDGRYMYYLLQQNGGSVYIVCGHYDSESELDPYSDDSEVWRMFRLEETSEAK